VFGVTLSSSGSSPDERSVLSEGGDLGTWEATRCVLSDSTVIRPVATALE
jgi:hypothetical protein